MRLLKENLPVWNNGLPLLGNTGIINRLIMIGLFPYHGLNPRSC